MPRRGNLTDAQWEKIKELLPRDKAHGGRPWRSHRQVINAILWVLRTGAPWRDLPARYGPWSTAYSRFRRWRDEGVWRQLVAQLHASAHANATLDWSLHMLDGTVIRAHHHGAGALLAGKTPSQRATLEALGHSRGGLTTKPIIRIDACGRLRGLVLAPGHRHESLFFEELMNQGAVQGPTGRPKLRPARIVADKAYNVVRIRRWCASHGVNSTIPRNCNQRRRGPFDRELYRRRNLVERKFNRFKDFRGLATRYDKLASSFHARFWIVELFLETA
ncbi:MAG: IS5 family transposase [Myxococcales bacterium]|nr:IS5 family transposase [Myxococcales bacterium]